MTQQYRKTSPEESSKATEADATPNESKGDVSQRVAGHAPRVFWTPKSGNALTDYEDAYALGDDCLAIADGATESSFSRIWAQQLAAGFVANPAATLSPSTQRLQTWLQPLQETWHAGVAWDSLPWYAEDKARSGAFATLLTFQILPSKESSVEDIAKDKTDADTTATDESQPNASEPSVAARMESPLAISFLGAAQSLLGENLLLDVSPSRFEVCAVGDSCLFQLRDEMIELAFPLTHSSQFDSRPVLLSSNPVNNKQVWEDIVLERGVYMPGDVLLFATDALAKWFLGQVEAGEYPWEILCALSTQEEFDTFVGELRRSHAMRNDDVTLIIVGELPGEQTGMTLQEDE